MCLIKHILITPSLQHHYNKRVSENAFYKSVHVLVIFFNLSHTSHSIRMHDFNSIVITRVQNMWHFCITKSLWLMERRRKSAQLVQAVPWLALPERMSPACSQAEKHTQIPSNVNQSWHFKGRFHSLLSSFTTVNILQIASRRGVEDDGKYVSCWHWETGQTHLCIKITVDGSNFI